MVLRINKGGKITTFVGKAGFSGLSGDGGPVSEALLRGPTGLTVDPAGSLYITDHGNHRVRKVDADGTITTVVGSGPEGSASGGFSGDDGLATKGRLQEPVAVAVDRADRILIADRDNYRVRAVDADGTITTLAGDGSTGPERINGPATKAALGCDASRALAPRRRVLLRAPRRSQRWTLTVLAISTRHPLARAHSDPAAAPTVTDGMLYVGAEAFRLP